MPLHLYLTAQLLDLALQLLKLGEHLHQPATLHQLFEPLHPLVQVAVTGLRD